MIQTKFRFWHIKEKKMFYDDNQLFVSGTGHIFNAKSGVCVDTDYYKKPTFIAMQFTGLTDKNGKEIYESDIIVFAYEDELIKSVVVFENGCFSIIPEPEESKNSYPLYDYLHQSLEVIGNVFENSNLLK